MPTFYCPHTGNPEIHETQPPLYLTTQPTTVSHVVPRHIIGSSRALTEGIGTEPMPSGEFPFEIGDIVYVQRMGTFDNTYTKYSVTRNKTSIRFGDLSIISEIVQGEEARFWCSMHPNRSTNITPPKGNFYCGGTQRISQYDDHPRHTQTVGGNLQVMPGEQAATVILSSIKITTPPNKTSYIAGETFNSAGMVVKAVYSDGTERVLTNYSQSPTGALTTANTNITITFTEGGITKTVSQAITVTAVVVLSSIAVASSPTKTAYAEGEYFSTSGMVIRATYSDGTTRNVTGYTCSPSGALSAGTSYITIQYSEGSVTKTTTQNINVQGKSSSQLVTEAWGSNKEWVKASTGNSTLTIPATGTYEFIIVGGHGGGGGGSYWAGISGSSAYSLGGAGGLGAAYIVTRSLTKGQVISIRVGPGGAGAVNSMNAGGVSGSYSSVTVGSTTYYADGGGGGGAGMAMATNSSSGILPSGGSGGSGGTSTSTYTPTGDGMSSTQTTAGKGGVSTYSAGVAGTYANPIPGDNVGISVDKSGQIYFSAMTNYPGTPHRGDFFIKNKRRNVNLKEAYGSGFGTGQYTTQATNGDNGFFAISFIS